MKKVEKLGWYRKEFDKISNDIKNSKFLSYCNFLRIRNFKLQNLTTEEENNIKEKTEAAFQLAKEDKIIEAIGTLTKLNGVGVPTASAILAMKYPDKFAIIDKNVIRKLGKNEWRKDYKTDPKIYKEYLILMRKKSKSDGRSLRDVEREMFEGRPKK